MGNSCGAMHKYTDLTDTEPLYQGGDGEKILGCSVKREYTLLENQGYIVAIGDNLKRKKLYETLLRGQAGKPESVISEQADIGWKAKIERGTFVASGTHIGPEAWIGEDTIINTGSVI